MKQKCKVCGENAYSEYCFKHKPNKLMKNTSTLKKSSIRPKLASQRHQKEKDIQTINPMWEFFLQIWNKRAHVSEVSGERLPSPPTSLYFHHILLKSKHPQAKFASENIILLTPEEHQRVHYDMYSFEEVNNRRESLLKKYNL